MQCNAMQCNEMQLLLLMQYIRMYTDVYKRIKEIIINLYEEAYILINSKERRLRHVLQNMRRLRRVA